MPHTHSLKEATAKLCLDLRSFQSSLHVLAAQRSRASLQQENTNTRAPLLCSPNPPDPTWSIHRLFAPNWRTQGSEASERFCYLALLAAMDQPKSQPRRSSSSARAALRLTPTADSQSRCGERGALASKSALRQQNARVLAQKQKQSHHKPEGDISTGIAFPTRVQISLLVTGNWTRTIWVTPTFHERRRNPRFQFVR